MTKDKLKKLMEISKEEYTKAHPNWQEELSTLIVLTRHLCRTIRKYQETVGQPKSKEFKEIMESVDIIENMVKVKS